RNRTDDLFITSELLYRLSYIGTCIMLNITPEINYFKAFYSEKLQNGFFKSKIRFASHFS
ncbi:MAG: hypothetical protein IJW35_02120, partial [Lentisphaeria bacterium]|nr:hypothetical protein [Lentisphaeria bacterium]